MIQEYQKEGSRRSKVEWSVFSYDWMICNVLPSHNGCDLSFPLSGVQREIINFDLILVCSIIVMDNIVSRPTTQQGTHRLESQGQALLAG